MYIFNCFKNTTGLGRRFKISRTFCWASEKRQMECWGSKESCWTKFAQGSQTSKSDWMKKKNSFSQYNIIFYWFKYIYFVIYLLAGWKSTRWHANKWYKAIRNTTRFTRHNWQLCTGHKFSTKTHRSLTNYQYESAF